MVSGPVAPPKNSGDAARRSHATALVAALPLARASLDVLIPPLLRDIIDRQTMSYDQAAPGAVR
jgi:hypothetical protein